MDKSPPKDLYWYWDKETGKLKDYWIWRASPNDIRYIREDKAANNAVRVYIKHTNKKLRKAHKLKTSTE